MESRKVSVEYLNVFGIKPGHNTKWELYHTLQCGNHLIVVIALHSVSPSSCLHLWPALPLHFHPFAPHPLWGFTLYWVIPSFFLICRGLKPDIVCQAPSDSLQSGRSSLLSIRSRHSTSPLRLWHLPLGSPLLLLFFVSFPLLSIFIHSFWGFSFFLSTSPFTLGFLSSFLEPVQCHHCAVS